MGVTGVGWQLAYQQANTIEFVFEDVLVDSVYPTALAKYLSTVKPNIASPIIDDLNEEGGAFVITETIKSNRFGVVAYDQKGAVIDVDVAGIQNVLGATSKVSVSKDAIGIVSYIGQKFLRFGFKACPIWVEIESGNAKFKLSPPKGHLTLRMMVPTSLTDPNEPTTVLLARDTLLRLR